MKKICLVMGAMLCATQVHADTNAVRTLTLEQAIEMALERNLDVQISRLTPLIDRFTLEGSYGAYDASLNFSGKQIFNDSPGSFNPTTGFNNSPSISDEQFFKAELGAPGGGGMLTPWGMTYDLSSQMDRLRPLGKDDQFRPTFTFALDQPLLKNFWIDTTRRDILVNKKNLKFDELGLRLQIISTVTATEEAYYALVASFGTVQVQEKAVQLAQQLVNENLRKVEVGTLAPLDEKQSESQLASSQADLLAARQALSAQEDVLRGLVTDDFRGLHSTLLVPAEPLRAPKEEFDLQQSWKNGMTGRPDLLQAKVNLEKQDIVLRFQKNQLFPSLDLIGSYGRTGSEKTPSTALGDIENERFPNYYFGAALSIPLGNRTARNNYKATKAQIQQLLLKYKQLEETILIQIQDTIGQAQSSFERSRATRQAREYAEMALEAEQKKMAAGKSTSFQVLQLQRDLTTARSAEIQALADYNKFLAELSKNEGSTLERHNLNVKIQ